MNSSSNLIKKASKIIDLCQKIKLAKKDQGPPVVDHQGNISGNALGITPETKDKLKFDPGFGQKEYRKYVAQRADHIPATGYAVGEIEDFNWHYEPEYDIEKLSSIKDNADGWKSWFRGEMVEWVYDHGDERKGHFEKWAKNSHAKPLIIIQGTDDRPHVWDGHHGCAAVFLVGMKTVPVIYGTRKS